MICGQQPDAYLTACVTVHAVMLEHRYTAAAEYWWGGHYALLIGINNYCHMMNGIVQCDWSKSGRVICRRTMNISSDFTNVN